MNTQQTNTQQPQELDPEVEGTKAYILSLCSAIGGLEEIEQSDGTVEQVYCVGDEALACLRDLKKAIRVDSTNNEKIVLKALVEYNVIETDIVPLILSFQKERNEVSFRFILACVELLVPMTWPVEKNTTPVDLDTEEQEPEDPNLMICYRKYKMDLLRHGVFETIFAMVMRSVRIPHRDRSIVDHTTIRLALYLFRNLTAIPDLGISSISATPEQMKLSTLQEALMMRYYESDVIEFLLTIASNSQRQSSTPEWNLLVLESIYNIIKHIDPKDVYNHKITESVIPDKSDMHAIATKLKDLLTEEHKSKKQKTAYVPTRHNRFGGTYVLDYDGKKKVSHKQVAGFADPATLVQGDKIENRIGLKRKLEDKTAVRKVYKNKKALKYLKQTVQAFIVSCFNAIFTCIMKDMQREDDKIVPQDYNRYYYTMKWFLEYVAISQIETAKRKQTVLLLPKQPLPAFDDDDHDNKQFDFSLVASAIDLKTVLFCLRHTRMQLNEKEWFAVQMAMDCFRQVLFTVGMMAKSTEQQHKDIAEHIQSNLYYEQAHLDLFVELIKLYKNQSGGYLKCVIQLNDVLLKLLDEYQKGKKMLFVRRAAKKPKKKKVQSTQEGGAQGTAEEPMIAADVSSEEEESENEDQARNRQAEYKEQVFKFGEFEKKYISVDVIHTYCQLLEHYMDLEPIYIRCIVNMFHRIMVKKRVEFLFWKLPVLDLFNTIIQTKKQQPKLEEFHQLRVFIRFVSSKFFSAAKEYPLLYVEALIPNMKSDRQFWEAPHKQVQREESAEEQERYMNDVNYIPQNIFNNGQQQATAQTREGREREKTSDLNEIDDDMVDYYFSAFDTRKEEEAAADTNKEVEETVIRENTENVINL